jgi:hypothetical protein
MEGERVYRPPPELSDSSSLFLQSRFQFLIQPISIASLPDAARLLNSSFFILLCEEPILNTFILL